MAPATPPGLTLSLTGKVALVTGGSRGIGAATVRLLPPGWSPRRLQLSHRSADRAADLVAECGGEEVCRASATGTCHIGRRPRPDRRRNRCLWPHRLPVVNHGIWPPHDQPIATMTVAQWRRHARHQPRQRLRPRPGRNRPDAPPAARTGTATRGHIVLVASTAAQRGEAFHADYAASKGALLSLTKSLSTELAPQGILCNCVAPGWVRTEMSAGTLLNPDHVQENVGSNSAWPRGGARGDRRADRLPLHAVGGIRLRRSVQRQWRSSLGRINQDARDEIRDANDN